MERSVQARSLLSAVLGGSDPDERLRALSELRGELDSLETELTAEALRRGRSWRQIGAALGISKQAAHRRHSHSVSQLDRAAEAEQDGSAVIVSAEARLAVRLARREASAMGQTAVGTEHLLLGLLQCGDRDAVAVLARLGVTLPAARDAVQPTVEIPREVARQAVAAAAAGSRSLLKTSVSPLASRALQRALAYAIAGGTGSLCALDLLRALVLQEEGGAARTMAMLGVSPDAARAALAEQRAASDAPVSAARPT